MPVGGGTASTLLGIADNVSAGTITLKLVQPFDASGKAAVSSPAASTGTEYRHCFRIDSVELHRKRPRRLYTLSSGNKTVTLSSSTAIILENKEYAPGSVSDITKGDFLAVTMVGNTVILVIDNGPANNPADQTNQGTSTSGGMETGASPAPSAGASPSPGASPNAGSAGATDGKTYVVNADNLKARSGPGTNFDILFQMTMGQKLAGVVENGWLKFTLNGKNRLLHGQLPEGGGRYGSFLIARARQLPAQTNPSASPKPSSSARKLAVVGGKNV